MAKTKLPKSDAAPQVILLDEPDDSFEAGILPVNEEARGQEDEERDGADADLELLQGVFPDTPRHVLQVHLERERQSPGYSIENALNSFSKLDLFPLYHLHDHCHSSYPQAVLAQ